MNYVAVVIVDTIMDITYITMCSNSLDILLYPVYSLWIELILNQINNKMKVKWLIKWKNESASYSKYVYYLQTHSIVSARRYCQCVNGLDLDCGTK